MVSLEAVGDDTVMVSAEVLATVMAAEAGAAAQRATSRASGARSLRMAGEGTGGRMRTGRAIDGAPGRPDPGASRGQAAAGSGSASPGSGGCGSSAGPGVRIAPAMTAAKPATRATSDSVSDGSGSAKTSGPAAIVTTLAAALVIAMTATARPSRRQ